MMRATRTLKRHGNGRTRAKSGARLGRGDDPVSPQTRRDLVDSSAIEGILVRDLDHNPNTVTAAELFGATSGDGFADLAAMDTNHDGKIDAGDTNFADLKVWIDADSDGVVDSGEVISLTAAGVAAINLNA